ncbi:MAG: ribonuclease Y [Candidatus Paceibacterota bacterium]|jgi:ribonuclease Y|nr:ribonuclease Y [Candidatus Paceibacterota bacterium]
MSLQILLLIAITLAGVAFGYYLRLLVSLGKKGSMEMEIKQMLLNAKEDAQKITTKAEKEVEKKLEEFKKEEKEKKEALKKTEDRYIKKEELLDKRQQDIDREVEGLKQKVVEIKKIREDTDALKAVVEKDLARVANLTPEKAKEELILKIEKQSEEDILVRIQKLEMTGSEKIERKAKEMLTTAIHRLGNSVSSDVLTTAVTIPNDEIKGKIIGKEGRNIRAFERVAGVELIVDDTPGSITISAFDPVRRNIAKLALENLIADGRIQPVKIEEMVDKAKNEINKIIKSEGEKAVYECGVFNLDPRVVSILGRLHFRTSYGQNVLQHSIEMSHIAGMLATELGADIQIAKAGALLHDIGKAVDHEIQGTHVDIGRRILQKFGADERIIKAMQAHHEEYPYETMESILVQVADAISGGRPGARRDSVENYIKRLEELERIANSFTGVEKAYALQAGREIRIFVFPDAISDLEAKRLAREVALKVENELKYPGEIKVNVIRETRVVEYAR